MIIDDATLGRLVIFVTSAIPLYFSLELVKGRVSFPKVILVSFMGGILVAGLLSWHAWGGAAAFFLLILLYRLAFRLKWWRAIFVWLVQGAFFMLALYLGEVLLGLMISFA